jgi:hypothetical protein
LSVTASPEMELHQGLEDPSRQGQFR